MPKQAKKSDTKINEDLKKKKGTMVDEKDGAEKEEGVGGEKFFREFSRSDFIGENEVTEVDITEAFDPAEELGFGDDTYNDESY